MSADNFHHIKKFNDGWRIADLSASAFWSFDDWDNVEVNDSQYTEGPFSSFDEALDWSCNEFVEYGTFGKELKGKLCEFQT